MRPGDCLIRRMNRRLALVASLLHMEELKILAEKSEVMLDVTQEELDIELK